MMSRKPSVESPAASCPRTAALFVMASFTVCHGIVQVAYRHHKSVATHALIRVVFAPGSDFDTDSTACLVKLK